MRNAAFIAEYPDITSDLGRLARRLFGIVGELHRRLSIGRTDLADQRDRIELVIGERRAIDEIIGEVGTPAEGHADLSREVKIGFLYHVDVQPVRKDEELFARIAALFLPP